MREFYSVSFCLFAVFSEPFSGIEALARGVDGLEKAHLHTPDKARDPFLNDGAPPPLVVQFYFNSLSRLERGCDAALRPLRGRCEIQAMLARSFDVPEPRIAAETFCTYLVAYEGKAEDESAWHAHYFTHHPPLMARLPGIRELEIYTPAQWTCPPGWRRAGAMQRNKVAFDSAQALSAALNSPARREMRADFRVFPAYSGRVTHYPMATRVIRGSGV